MQLFEFITSALASLTDVEEQQDRRGLTARIIYGQPDARAKVIVIADQQSMKFLEELTNCFGPSGFEKEPAKIVKSYVSKFSDKIYSDKLGSLMFEKKGTAASPVVLIPGHVDEVGFIISHISKLGFLSFNVLGGWFDQVLLGQRVVIKTEKGFVPGVIAAKPPHLLPAEERSKVVVKEKMTIDIGASNEEEAKAMGIRVGNPVIPDSRFSVLEKQVFKDSKKKGKDTIVIGKAFDDRIGAWMAAQAVRTLAEKKIRHPNTVVGAATTMEEVGLRGARTAAYMVKPDVCITLEVDLAGDVPGVEAYEANSKMGYGPTMTTFDSSMVPNQELVELVLKTADKNKIPLQLSQVKGGTDAGAIHQSYAGCPSIVLSVPTRHIHSHVGLLSMSDADNCVKLVVEVVKKLDKKTVDSLTAI